MSHFLGFFKVFARFVHFWQEIIVDCMYITKYLHRYYFIQMIFSFYRNILPIHITQFLSSMVLMVIMRFLAIYCVIFLFMTFSLFSIIFSSKSDYLWHIITFQTILQAVHTMVLKTNKKKQKKTQVHNSQTWP